MDPPAATTTTSATVAIPKAQSGSSSSPAAQGPQQPQPKPLSCTSCRARKLKCDRQHPCRNCVRSGLPECIFPERKRFRRPRKSKNSELLQRLHRLESIVGKVGLQNLGRDGSLSLQLDAGTTGTVQSYTAASDLLDSLVKQTEEATTTTTTTTPTPKTQSISPHEGTASSSPPGIPGSESQRQGAHQPPRPQDSSTALRYLSSDFWASLCEEVGGLRQALEQSVDSDGDEDDEEGTTPESTSTAKSPSFHYPSTAMLLGGSTAGDAHAGPLRHPPPEHIRFLTATYFQNVDMLLKILHRPTVSAALHAFADQLERRPQTTQTQTHLLSPEREALFFAIYYAAVTSLPTSKCAAHLGGAGRSSLAQSYRAGLERALARADYLNSSSLETLQALTLYTSCLRSHDGSRASWALLSLPIRLAQALDLHRDGEGDGRFTPFEAEQRRRLWWQLIVLDIRAAEDRGTRAIVARDSYDTRLPHNVDDADFGPDTAEPLARLEKKKPAGAPSDVTFSLCTAESSGIFLYFEHAQNIIVGAPPPSSSSSTFAAAAGRGGGGEDNSNSGSNGYPTDEATVVRLARHLEAKFVHGADPAHAASYLASVTVRLIILKLWLMMRYPLHRRPPHPHPTPTTTTTTTTTMPPDPATPPPPAVVSHESTLRTAITIMELSERGRSGPFGENFRWWSELYVQWHPLAVALAELCTLHHQHQHQQQRQLTDRAWAVIDAVFPKWSEVIADTKRGTLWRPIRALYRKAREARRAAEEEGRGGGEGQDDHASSSNTTEEGLSREQWRQQQQQTPRPSDLDMDMDMDMDIGMDMGMGAGIGEVNLDLEIAGSTTSGYDGSGGGGAMSGDSNIPPDLGNLSLDMHLNGMSQEWLAWPDISFDMPPSDNTNWSDMDWSTWDQFVLDTRTDHQSKSSSSEPT
ncbi:fungal-specific transcription factor domain-containing protein [Biscogniauxia sp. FL1348]|nr:fungal-specific transcription factor domain-containing protein [Biscogniauxia sp. FL1348]